MQLACHDLLVCKYLTLYIRVLLFIMCFKFFHHAPLGNQFVLKELACLNKVLPTNVHFSLLHFSVRDFSVRDFQVRDFQVLDFQVLDFQVLDF